MTETKEEEKVVLHNQGSRVIHTKFGDLAIGGSLEVPASAAPALLDYRGVVDAAKLVPQNTQKIDQYKGRVAALEAENARLREENAKANEAPAKPTDFEETVAPEKRPAKEPVSSGKRGR